MLQCILIYTDETPEEHDFRFRPSQSSDRLNEKKSCGVAHHMISIQLDGTSGPSTPISMDIVGLSYFEVNFSKTLGKETGEKHENAANCKRKIDDRGEIYPNIEFVVPVVFDLHITLQKVILLNTTSKPVELRFDTPFGVCPKVLGQIYPGQKFPLPLHLAESGHMSWCPLETGFLWSEAQVFLNVLSHETKLGSFKSFVCYPFHPSNDPFRCCLSVQHINLLLSSRRKNGSSVHTNESQRHSDRIGDQSVSTLQSIKTPSIHYVTLTAPLMVKNNMPEEVSVTIDSGGSACTILIAEVNYACIYHIDSTHDLDLVFHVHGFRPIISMFPRAEAFVAVARFHENKFSQSETLTFYPDSSNGPIYVTVEKTMDAFCGAREICIFVSFLLYNCTGLPITVADLGHEREGCTMPPCYHLIEMDQHQGRKDSPIRFSSTQDSYATPPYIDSISDVSSKKHSILSSESPIQRSRRGREFINSDSSKHLHHPLVDHDLVFHGASLNNVSREYFEKGRYKTDLVDIEGRKVKACMYFPHSSSSASELMVRLSICMPNYFTDSKASSVWSSPFYLVPASGSTCVVVPKTNTSGAFIVSVTSNPLAGSFYVGQEPSLSNPDMSLVMHAARTCVSNRRELIQYSIWALDNILIFIVLIQQGSCWFPLYLKNLDGFGRDVSFLIIWVILRSKCEIMYVVH
ncbi:hypothetical protein AQUCO_07100036v1 [Aquilegia coerulea]|uniref:Vacuolar protein sorting-associated protein 13 VPS13 adaptor binding domain-containing protein n=1 Tax=Aquilegia coerulea TaxID=218851 RepID=A0A2G5CAS7_AQUCA|nr:hypothetical protein AQUCO_07100036v1 [Aquilegia coerulea]